jgi:hypothetical protein
VVSRHKAFLATGTPAWKPLHAAKIAHLIVLVALSIAIAKKKKNAMHLQGWGS